MNCCFGPKLYEHIQIPPHSTIEFECEVHTVKPGPFQCDMGIYLDDNGIVDALLSVEGVAVE